MTAEDDCGLNLVYDPPSSLAGVAAALGGGGRGKPAKRAKNKYDRRREKGRRAKELAEQKRLKSSNGVGGDVIEKKNGGRGRQCADGQASASIEIEDETKSDPPSSQQTSNENEAVSAGAGCRIQSEPTSDKKAQTESSESIPSRVEKDDGQSGESDDADPAPAEEQQSNKRPPPQVRRLPDPPRRPRSRTRPPREGSTAKRRRTTRPRGRRTCPSSTPPPRPRQGRAGVQDDQVERAERSHLRRPRGRRGGGRGPERPRRRRRRRRRGGVVVSLREARAALEPRFDPHLGKREVPARAADDRPVGEYIGVAQPQQIVGEEEAEERRQQQPPDPVRDRLGEDPRLPPPHRAVARRRCFLGKAQEGRQIIGRNEAAMDLCSAYPWIVPGCLSGGEKRKSEKARLRKGISILVATPGRLLDHLGKTECLLLSLKGKLEWLVLDEADRLLDAGLGHQIGQIVQHLRSNQPRAGPGRDGVTWRSVLVSATISREMEGLAETMLGGGDGWVWARGRSKGGKSKVPKPGGGDEGDDDDVKPSSSSGGGSGLDHSAPRQLAQLYMVVSAKLRLASLVAFLAARAAQKERTVVFISTCDGVDYHHALFNSAECVLGESDDKDDSAEGRSEGMLGKKCPIYKLHGDVPHDKRMSTLESFGRSESAVLLATDVAARGLNFPDLDWIVQYDPPCETKDYVHRAGRSARAGRAGHALLFLLPSERRYVEVLRLRGLEDVSPLSLSATLTKAAELCPGVAQEGSAKAAGNTFSDGSGEAFTTAVQTRLEQTILDDDARYKTDMDKKFKGMDQKQRRKLQRKEKPVGPLLEGARKAFSAFVRAYPAKERAVRPIFNARALHLGHVARSLALKDAPRMGRRGGKKR
ncbi:hypothetical protein THAOC_16870, partial [Thalassiosira oceanica]